MTQLPVWTIPAAHALHCCKRLGAAQPPPPTTTHPTAKHQMLQRPRKKLSPPGPKASTLHRPYTPCLGSSSAASVATNGCTMTPAYSTSAASSRRQFPSWAGGRSPRARKSSFCTLQSGAWLAAMLCSSCSSTCGAREQQSPQGRCRSPSQHVQTLQANRTGYADAYQHSPEIPTSAYVMTTAKPLPDLGSPSGKHGKHGRLPSPGQHQNLYAWGGTRPDSL